MSEFGPRDLSCLCLCLLNWVFSLQPFCTGMGFCQDLLGPTGNSQAFSLCLAQGETVASTHFTHPCVLKSLVSWEKKKKEKKKHWKNWGPCVQKCPQCSLLHSETMDPSWGCFKTETCRERREEACHLNNPFFYTSVTTQSAPHNRNRRACNNCECFHLSLCTSEE